MPRLLPYAKPPLRGARRSLTHESHPFSATACDRIGKSPEALSITTTCKFMPGVERSLSSERRHSIINRAERKLTLTTQTVSSARSHGCGMAKDNTRSAKVAKDPWSSDEVALPEPLRILHEPIEPFGSDAAHPYGRASLDTGHEVERGAEAQRQAAGTVA